MTRTDGSPRQAVILAGGLGTRLLPLTRTRPKPMVEFNGRPFLEYIVEMLAAHGIERIVMLLGYLPEIVQSHFGDGSRLGVQIEYSVGPVEDETGARVRRSAELLDERFLLLYCDNYWPMRLREMWQWYVRSGAQMLVTVYNNADGYSRNNMLVDDDGFVVAYDKSRTRADVNGVDIGFMILERETLDLLDKGNVSFEKSLFPKLIERKQLAAYRTDHRYYSVGTRERLDETERFLAAHPTVLLDRDGVLNVKQPRAQYVESWDQWCWLPGAKAALARLKDAGYRVLVITNQPGVARGRMTAEALQEIHRRMADEAELAGGRIDGVYSCMHGWDEGCDCRKPRPGLLFNAQRDHALDLTRVYFFGDDERDAEAAALAGCPFMRIEEGFPLSAAVDALLNEHIGK